MDREPRTTKSFVICLLLGIIAAQVAAIACSSPMLSPTPTSTLTQAPLSFRSPIGPFESPVGFESPLGTELPEVTASPGTEIPPSKAPTPRAGEASISGTLHTLSGHGPIPETVFYLTPAVGEDKQDPPSVLVGAREEEGDIRGTSDTEGRVFLNNIPPGNYYLAVWAPYDWILAVESAADSTPRLIVVEPNQQEDLGTVYLSWP